MSLIGLDKKVKLLLQNVTLTFVEHSEDFKTQYMLGYKMCYNMSEFT